jgi:hypothetical protein
MNKDVRVADMLATYTGLVSLNNSIQLPADCRSVQALRVNDGGAYREMKPLPPTRLTEADAASRLGYVAQGRVLQLIGGSGQPDFALDYYQAIPALADSPMQINWLIQREPGLYLYASLLEASPYIQDDNRAAVWAQQYRDILDAMHAEDGYRRYGNAPSATVGGP